MGMIFDLQRFSLNDGPGIRTTVFLKGCPLKCIWCHNPESKSSKPQLSYNPEKCVGCRKCLICPNDVHSFEDGHKVDFSKCITCGKCIEQCDFGALTIYGYEATADEIIDIVEKDRIYYDVSCGGMTVSGGEPMFQPEFTLSLLKKSKERGIGTAIETSGYAKTEYFERIFPYVDWFLYDYKADKEHHKELTGVDNSLIIKNLSFLCNKKAKIILRCPIVPGVNENRVALENLVKTFPQIHSVEMLPYHSMWKTKAKNIGMSISDMLD